MVINEEGSVMKRKPHGAVHHIPRPTAGRRARRQAETRARILRAALDLFAQQGYSSTTVEQITDAADVGKGTFFNYFPSKEHVMAGFGEMQRAKVEQALFEGARAGWSTRQTWRHLTHELAREPGNSPSLVRGLLIANLSSDFVCGHMQRNLALGREILAQLIASGQQRGELRSGLDPSEVARLFQQMFLGAMLFWALDSSSELAEWLDKAFDLFWSAVEAPAAPPEVRL
jgi:AcrR family transcriptional regulator